MKKILYLCTVSILLIGLLFLLSGCCSKQTGKETTLNFNNKVGNNSIVVVVLSPEGVLKAGDIDQLLDKPVETYIDLDPKDLIKTTTSGGWKDILKDWIGGMFKYATQPETGVK